MFTNNFNQILEFVKKKNKSLEIDILTGLLWSALSFMLQILMNFCDKNILFIKFSFLFPIFLSFHIFPLYNFTLYI